MALCVPFSGKNNYNDVILFIIFYVLYIFISSLNINIDFGIRFIFGYWTAKIFAMIFCVSFISFMNFSRRELGLNAPIGRKAYVETVVGIFSAVLIASVITFLDKFIFRPPIQDIYYIDIWAFRATMPGVSEELAFRGIGIAILTRAIKNSNRNMSQILLPYFITTILFSVSHIIFDKNGLDITASLVRIFGALTLGIVFAMIRFRTKSLLGGVVAHNAANLAVTLVHWSLR